MVCVNVFYITRNKISVGSIMLGLFVEIFASQKILTVRKKIPLHSYVTFIILLSGMMYIVNVASAANGFIFSLLKII